jgi:cellulose biosynthesis protein BcsQ
VIAAHKAREQRGGAGLQRPDIMADRLAELQSSLSPPPLRQSPSQLPQLLQITDLKPYGRVPPEHILVKPDYLDFIIIDHAPNPMALGNACLGISTEIWAPVIPEPQPFEGLLQMLATVKKTFQAAPEKQPAVRGILPSQVYHRYQIHNSTLASMYAYFGSLITRSVHRASEIPNAQGEQPPQTVFEYARSSRSSKEWVDLALHIEGSSGTLANNVECEYCMQIREGIAAKRAATSAMKQ